jgi:hypothetical protein
MSSNSNAGQLGGTRTSLLLAGAVGLLALPSAVLALSSRFEALPEGNSAIQTIVTGRIDPRLARSISVRALANGSLFRFTPAKQAALPGREVTIAVLNSGFSHSILVRAPVGAVASAEQVSAAPSAIAPMAYNLGVARGYKGFAPSAPRSNPIPRAALPDLASFDARGSNTSGGTAGRLQPRIELDERANAGRAPRTLAGDGEQTVDVGGSYRVGRNLNVTAGVRYSQERDRLRPLENGRQDGQAVYVGTQFRF